MKRWTVALVLVLLACLPLFILRAPSESMLRDSDTVALLNGIRDRQNPLVWFTGDWPLGNHFYRPISTLTFELDNALFGTNPEGYGSTNLLLAIACVMALFWLLRELTDHVLLTTASSVLFAIWHIPKSMPFGTAGEILACLVILASVLRSGLSGLGRGVIAALVIFYASCELAPIGSLFSGVLSWLPGRTATVMALFILLSMAAYARYERLSAVRVRPEPTPLDPPATKGTQVTSAKPRLVWVWPALSLLCLGLALGSYEQAVMGPALLLAVAVTLRFFGYQVRWGWQVSFWALLVGYLAVRQYLVPSDASRYQMQAFRSGPGVLLDLGSYVFPGFTLLPSLLANFSSGWIVLLLGSTWRNILVFTSNIVAAVQARLRWRYVAPGYAMSVLAFLPMAWLKRFEHYHYLPMAFRAFYAAALLWVALDLLVTAVSPRARQAPRRSSPAPGSLPRR